MARPRNELETKTVTVSANPGIREYLLDLLQTQLFGNSTSDAALMLIQEGIDAHIAKGTITKRTFPRPRADV